MERNRKKSCLVLGVVLALLCTGCLRPAPAAPSATEGAVKGVTHKGVFNYAEFLESHTYSQNGIETTLEDWARVGYVIDGFLSPEQAEVQILDVFEDIYGQDIYDYLPYLAYYDECANVWYIRGTLHAPGEVIDTAGGTPEMIIYADGQHIFVWHSQ
jgi:hypothetical protein